MKEGVRRTVTPGSSNGRVGPHALLLARIARSAPGGAMSTAVTPTNLAVLKTRRPARLSPSSVIKSRYFASVKVHRAETWNRRHQAGLQVDLHALAPAPPAVRGLERDRIERLLVAHVLRKQRRRCAVDAVAVELDAGLVRPLGDEASVRVGDHTVASTEPARHVDVERSNARHSDTRAPELRGRRRLVSLDATSPSGVERVPSTSYRPPRSTRRCDRHVEVDWRNSAPETAAR